MSHGDSRAPLTAVLDRFPDYGSEGCLCGNVATPSPDCALHFAIVEMERIGDVARRAEAERDRFLELLALAEAHVSTGSSLRPQIREALSGVEEHDA